MFATYNFIHQKLHFTTDVVDPGWQKDNNHQLHKVLNNKNHSYYFIIYSLTTIPMNILKSTLSILMRHKKLSYLRKLEGTCSQLKSLLSS